MLQIVTQSAEWESAVADFSLRTDTPAPLALTEPGHGESSISYREWRQKSRAFCVRVRVISERHVLIKGRGSIYRLAPREAKKGTTSSGKDR